MRKIQDKIDAVCLHRSWLHHIKGDLFKISERIREINDGYFIVFNIVRQKYEVHNVDTKGPSTYEFTVPFDRLDARTLDFCKETLMANKVKILENMRKEEEKRNKEYQRNIHNMNEDRAIELANDLRRAI